MNHPYELGLHSKAFRVKHVAVLQAKELEEKHNITSKVGGAVALGMDSLTKAMGKGNKSGDSVAPASSGFPDVPK